MYTCEIQTEGRELQMLSEQLHFRLDFRFQSGRPDVTDLRRPSTQIFPLCCYDRGERGGGGTNAVVGSTKDGRTAQGKCSRR